MHIQVGNIIKSKYVNKLQDGFMNISMTNKKPNLYGDRNDVLDVVDSAEGDIGDDIESEFVMTLDRELSKYIENPGLELEVYPGTESMYYDFTAERRSIFFSANLTESTANLVKGCIGCGILGIHEAYMHGGLCPSLAATVLIGIVCPYNMLTLVKSAQWVYIRLRIPKLTYAELIDVAIATGPMRCCRKYSKGFRYTLEFLQFVHMCSICCIYQIMIASTIKQIMEKVSENVNEFQLSVRIYILIITVPLIAMCLIKNLKNLAPFSVIADIFTAVCVAAALFYSMSNVGDITQRSSWNSVHGFFRFIGVAVFSIDGIYLALPIENHMRSPHHFLTVLQYGIPFVVVCTAASGFFGYWAWGENCKSPITTHMPFEIGPTVIQFVLAFMLAATFTLQFWVPFKILWHYFGRKFKKKRGTWERVLRMLHFALITCFSVAFPHSDIIMSFYSIKKCYSRIPSLRIQSLRFADKLLQVPLQHGYDYLDNDIPLPVGNILLAFASFIFPPLIETLVTWHDPQKKR